MHNKYSKYNNYDLSPYKMIKGFEKQAFGGYEAILGEIRRLSEQGKRIFVFDYYPGVNQEEIKEQLLKLSPTLIVEAEECALTGGELTELFADNLTDDRVFGIITHKKLKDCLLEEKIESVREQIANTRDGLIFIVGTGAGLISEGDVYFYFDMARWEIQLRYRKGLPNWRCNNSQDPILTKYKRGFFVEWRMADRYKKNRFETMDYVVDTNLENDPKMITGTAFRNALKQMSAEPFRVKPYFDPGVWGGQWMKGVFGLDEKQDNFAWSFDGVPEENSLQLKFGEVMIEIPCMDLVLYCPRQLLGERVHGRFGAEFPIRFDLLDTMEGGKLSLQVHPLTEYIQDEFGMNYTQDESYYILDAGEGSSVYLGVKENVDKAAMIADLKKAERGNYEFPAKKYVNEVHVKKHDHILIPAGTIHCSGSNTMVLEISATPYIFTFKLWDWGRLGLDGKSRPIHVEHGVKNIQWERDTKWIQENLVGQVETCHEEKDLLVERTGLHNREFIDTHRYTFSMPVSCNNGDSVNMLNLVEGGQVTISSPLNDFEPFEVHYAETCIIPANVGNYTMTPSGISENQKITVIVAKVRE